MNVFVRRNMCVLCKCVCETSAFRLKSGWKPPKRHASLGVLFESCRKRAFF